MATIADWFDQVRQVPIVDVMTFLGIALTNNGTAKIRSTCILPHHAGPNQTLTLELRQTLLIPQGSFDPKAIWCNLYETWGLADDAIEDNLLGFDDGTLLPILKLKGYSDGDILKTGLFYRQDDGSIGDSVVKHRLTFPYLEPGRVTNFIARSTDKTWPCYTENPTATLQQSGYHYAKYKKLPMSERACKLRRAHRSLI